MVYPYPICLYPPTYLGVSCESCHRDEVFAVVKSTEKSAVERTRASHGTFQRESRYFLRYIKTHTDLLRDILLFKTRWKAHRERFHTFAIMLKYRRILINEWLCEELISSLKPERRVISEL